MTDAVDYDNELKCSQCGEDKTRADFHVRASANDGLASTCKACVKRTQHDRRTAARERRQRAEQTAGTEGLIRAELVEEIARLKGELAAALAHHEMFLKEMQLASGHPVSTYPVQEPGGESC